MFPTNILQQAIQYGHLIISWVFKGPWRVTCEYKGLIEILRRHSKNSKGKCYSIWRLQLICFLLIAIPYYHLHSFFTLQYSCSMFWLLSNTHAVSIVEGGGGGGVVQLRWLLLMSLCLP